MNQKKGDFMSIPSIRVFLKSAFAACLTAYAADQIEQQVGKIDPSNRNGNSKKLLDYHERLPSKKAYAEIMEQASIGMGVTLRKEIYEKPNDDLKRRISFFVDTGLTYGNFFDGILKNRTFESL
jgi:hypothetical protein